MQHNDDNEECYNGGNIMDASNDLSEGWTKCNNGDIRNDYLKECYKYIQLKVTKQVNVIICFCT